MADHYRLKTAMIVISKVKNKEIENFNIQKYFEMQFTFSYMTLFNQEIRSQLYIVSSNLIATSIKTKKGPKKTQQKTNKQKRKEKEWHQTEGVYFYESPFRAFIKYC